MAEFAKREEGYVCCSTWWVFGWVIGAGSGVGVGVSIDLCILLYYLRRGKDEAGDGFGGAGGKGVDYWYGEEGLCARVGGEGVF